ncbi:hypothetical protein QYE76_005399 [Lolium multiflorum]|uniref:Uncharacterized protein n=1 Tax=Lolium multiflorum TaxID=4521 RepID=A0AAD8W278_LOLMU|nr:hypothetical protein QYE76_005399 [Lolium multiflorum]
MLQFGTMLKRRREYDCTTGSTERSKPHDLVDTLEEQFGHLSTSGQGVWSELSKEVASKLSRSVFVIASFNGDEMRCSCSGIVIHWRPRLVTLLTSASLVRSLHDERKIDKDLTIRAWNQHCQYVDGWLEQYDLRYNIALVNVPAPVFLCPASLHHQIQLESGSKVVAVGCLFNSRKLMATSGVVMDKVSRFDTEEFLISTCKISKAGTGGPLVDFNGNFLGMNLYDAEQTTFLRRNIIIKRLERLGIFQPQNKQGGGCSSDILVRSTDSGVYLYANSYFDPEVPIDTVHKKLRSLGYPVPEKNCGGMKLVNRFEEKFPYMDGSCRSVLKDLSEEVALNLSCSVVSLASFNANTRLFACTGILIECTSVLTSASLVRSSDDENKIDDDLRIEVRLPNKQFVTGKLQHYNLHYNLAVVNIMASPDLHTAKFYHDVEFEPCCKVVAVGRIFGGGSLTATSGTLTDEPSKFDCAELLTSTCTITKAGIGGPLVDFDGNFIGMNFYDEENTPFIPRNVILECLRHFETERSITASSTNIDCSLNRWPVPKPYWVYPASDWDFQKINLRAAPPPMLL